jgi:AcrR family transcriptional regulator
MSGAGQATRRSRTPSAGAEQRLILAAEAILVRCGPAGLTVRAVAEEAGMAPMSVYNRIGGKAGLVNMLLVRGFDRLRAAIDAAREPDPVERLMECAIRYRLFALGNPGFYALMFEDAILCEKDPEVLEHGASAFGVLVRDVELVAAGLRIEAAPVQEAAQQLWSAVHGAVELELKGLMQTPDPLATYRETARAMFRGLGWR